MRPARASTRGPRLSLDVVIVRWPRQRLTVVLLSNRNEDPPYATALAVGALFLRD